MAKTPMRSPDVTRLTASAMCNPVRSCRTMIVRISASAAASMIGFTGYPIRNSTPSRLRISAIARATLMVPLLLLTASLLIIAQVFSDPIGHGGRFPLEIEGMTGEASLCDSQAVDRVRQQAQDRTVATIEPAVRAPADDNKLRGVHSSENSVVVGRPDRIGRCLQLTRMGGAIGEKVDQF